METDLRPLKKKMRMEMKGRRALTHANSPQSGVQLRDQFLKNVALPPDAIVASYAAIGTEIDPKLLADSLRDRGHPIVLPVVTGKGEILVFRLYDPKDQLTIGAFGVAEPLETASVLEPDVVLVPMLAFDRLRYRLGYGGGFYDRSIRIYQERKPLLAIGIAFDCQEVAEVPRGRYDVQLDKIVTENQVF